MADPTDAAGAAPLTAEELDDLDEILRYGDPGASLALPHPTIARLVAMARRGMEKGERDAVLCHGCEQTTHGEHVGCCGSCPDEVALWCCACWDAEDTGCTAPAREEPTDA